MLRIVTLALVVVFAGPGTALAGERILESAERLASAIVLTTQPNVQDCAEAARAGTSDAQRRQGSAGWFLLGWVLPIIAPLVAGDSQPPADTILQYDAELGRCYAASYRVNSTGRRNTSMRCCDAETETETVRPSRSACDAFAWPAAGSGACGAATVLEGDRQGAVE